MPKDQGRSLRPILGAIAISLAPLTPGCALLDEAPEVIEMPAQPPAIASAPVAPPIAEPVPEPVAAPAPPPEPAPDPEALAQAREEAARAAFEAEYPWHGVAYHFLAQVHRSPDGNSPVVGYMRRGATFRAQPPLRGPGCARGWSRVPGDGFVCRGNGFDLGDTPQSFDPSPVAPARSAALPYAYAWVVRPDAPQYWRLPTVAEEEEARAWIARERARENAPPPPPPAPVNDGEEAEGVGPQEGLEAPPGLDEEPTPEPGEPTDGGLPQADAGPRLDERPSFLRMRMRRGFYISVDRLETVGNRRFYRTVRGGFVPADVVAEASPPEMRGVVVGGRWRLPLGFVYRGGVRTLRRDPSRGVLAMADSIDRLTPLPLQEETVQRGQRRYRISDRGQIVREDALRIAQVIARPEGVAEDERWIHVDLSEQVVVAYEGDEPVFATLVSTGREGNETPVGTFRIQSKHVSTTMDDPNAGADAYSIEDVPWTMYFEGSYALHGAFWHDRFGRVRSHGCVNLAPADARWLFQWSSPTVPESWHGMSTRRGSVVHVTP
ncbi:MAG: L,D-transpeptidase [Sandaracinaceae bacterium]